MNHWHIQVRRAFILSVVDLLYKYESWVSKVTSSSLDDGQRQIVNIYLGKKEAEDKAAALPLLKPKSSDKKLKNQNFKSVTTSESKSKNS